MKAERIIRSIAIATVALLILTLLVMTIEALADLVPALVLLGVALLAVLGLRYARKRVRPGTVLEVDLDSGVVERQGSDPLSRMMHRNAVTVRDFVGALERASGDGRVSGLVARLGNGGIGIAHAQELRDAVHRFRESGKRAIAFAEAFGENARSTVDYYLATAFDEIYLQPNGLTAIEGLVARSTFLRGVFDRFGLVPDFDHRKEYKAAKYMLTETRFTEPHREAVEAVARDHFSQIVAGIATDRGLEPDTVERLIDSAPLTADEALEAGLVDHLGYRDDAYEAAGSRFMLCDRYLKRAGRPHRRGRRIALIYGTGSIVRGGSGFDPLTRGSSLGADDVAKAFREAIEAGKFAAIVFRVDSPGGSAVASEVVSHEVRRAREAGTPVVVSMGNFAGSGGYWISAGADKIVAQPGTITGSIGVVWGKLATRAAWARFGITSDRLTMGQNATFSSSEDVYTGTERARLDHIIDDIYDRFVGHVSSSRGLSGEDTEDIARGRIWTGAAARQNGLVDELGGLETAIAVAKEQAGIPAEDGVHIVTLPKARAIPIPERRESSEPIHAAAVIADVVSAIDGATSTAQARMPLWSYDL